MRLHHPFLMLALLAGVLFSARPALAATQGATPDASPTALPDTPVGRQLAWVLATLNDGTLTVDDVTARFAPSFLASLPAEQAVAATRQFAATYGPFTVDGLVRAATDTQAVALLQGNDGARLLAVASVEAAAPHRLTALIFQPAPPALTAATDDRLDGLFDVGDRRLYLSCMGMGNDGPTVVFEAGHGSDSTVWLAVQSALAPTTRVCAYDRANVPGGASDPAPLPRDGEDVVADLHRLLKTAEVPGPYVLVGHSLGGLFVRLYASAHPDDIAGLVLVDPSHEDQEDRSRELVGPDLWAALHAQAQGVVFSDAEGFDTFADLAKEVRAARAAPLPTVPLTVLTHGLPEDAAQLPPGWPIAAEEDLVRDLHQDLANLVPGGRLVVAEQSRHFIQLDQPDLVVESIAQVVDLARDPDSGLTPVVGTSVTEPTPDS